MGESAVEVMLEAAGPQRDEVARVLARASGLTPTAARQAVAWAPLPVFLGSRADAAALVERLASVGARASERPPLAPVEPCAAHARLLAAGECERCGRRMCLLCVRLGRGGRCEGCVTTARRRARRTGVVLSTLGAAGVLGAVLLARSARDKAEAAVGGSAIPAPPMPETQPAASTPRKRPPIDFIDAGAAPTTEPAPASSPESLPAAPASVEETPPSAEVSAAPPTAAPSSPEALALAEARAALAQGRLDQAIERLRSIRGDTPEAGVATLLLARAYHRQGDLGMARSAYQDAARRGGAEAAKAAQELAALTAGDELQSGFVERSAHFALRVPKESRGGSLTRGGEILRVLESNLGAILRDIPEVPGREIPVYVLSREEFDTRYGVTPGVVKHGVYLPAERAIYVNDTLGSSADVRGRETLAHELTHALIDRAVAGANPAVWVHEGLARYEGRRSVGLEPLTAEEWGALRRGAAGGTLPSLSTVRHSLGQDLVAYPLGGAVCVFVEQRYGMHRFVRYLEHLRGGASHDAAFREAFGADEARFEQDFREWLRSR